MTTRRALLGAALSVPVTALIGLELAGNQRHRFHLPLSQETALWRELVTIGVDEPGGAARFSQEIDRRDGAAVTLRGFMLSLREAPRHQHFILTANPIGCPACAADRPGMRVRVAMRDAAPTTGAPLTVRGALQLVRLGGILPYQIVDAVVL